jgi:hypothetical protein
MLNVGGEENASNLSNVCVLIDVGTCFKLGEYLPFYSRKRKNIKIPLSYWCKT